MKHRCFLTALLLVCLLCGCREKGETDIYEFSYRGKSCTVDLTQGTAVYDGETYQLEFTGGGDRAKLRVVYPDGSVYQWTENAANGFGGLSEDYDPEGKGYVPGDALLDMLESKAVKHKDADAVNRRRSAILLLAVGAFLALAPEKAWWLRYGWRFADAEPSDLALGVNRGVGALLLLLGVIFLLTSF